MNKQTIIDLYNSKMPIDDIIKFTQMSEHDIRVILKDNKVDRCRDYSQELQDRIVYLYQNGMRTADIYSQLCVTDYRVHKTLTERNIPRIPQNHWHRQNHRNSHYFDVIDSDDKAYALGWMFSDGNVYSPKRTVSLAVQAGDSEIIEWFKQQLDYSGKIIWTHEKSQNSDYKSVCKISISDYNLATQLYHLGVVDNKSLVMKYPTCIPRELNYAFIRGIFDGNGSISLCGGMPRISIVGTNDICINIMRLLADNNCVGRQYKAGRETSNTYSVCFNGIANATAFANFVYRDNCMRLSRKYEKFKMVVQPLPA